MKTYIIYFSGIVKTEAENEEEAMNKIDNDTILDSVEFDEIEEIEEDNN